MTLSLDLLHALLRDRGTLSAYDAARILMCRPEEVCVMAGDDWWTIEKLAGPEGFVYGRRTVIGPRQRLPKEVAVFDDSGINKRSPYMTA